MNRKRKVVVVAAIGIVALGLATAWSVRADDGWPPEPYKVPSITGLWTTPGGNMLWKIGPEDQFGTGVCEVIHLTIDPTLGGVLPDATSITPGYFKYLRTGSDTWQFKGFFYAMRDAKPQPVILGTNVVDITTKMIAPGEMEVSTMTHRYYYASQDKDLDGAPDEGEEPWKVISAPPFRWQAI